MGAHGWFKKTKAIGGMLLLLGVQSSCGKRDVESQQDRRDHVQELLRQQKTGEALQFFEETPIGSLTDRELILYAELMLSEMGLLNAPAVAQVKFLGAVDWVVRPGADPFLIDLGPNVASSDRDNVKELKLIWAVETYLAPFGLANPSQWARLEKTQTILNAVKEDLKKANFLKVYVQILFSKSQVVYQLQRSVTRGQNGCQFQGQQKSDTVFLVASELAKMLWAYQSYMQENDAILQAKLIDLQSFSGQPQVQYQNQGPYQEVEQQNQEQPPQQPPQQQAPPPVSPLYQQFLDRHPEWFCQ